MGFTLKLPKKTSVDNENLIEQTIKKYLIPKVSEKDIEVIKRLVLEKNGTITAEHFGDFIYEVGKTYHEEKWLENEINSLKKDILFKFENEENNNHENFGYRFPHPFEIAMCQMIQMMKDINSKNRRDTPKEEIIEGLVKNRFTRGVDICYGFHSWSKHPNGESVSKDRLITKFIIPAGTEYFETDSDNKQYKLFVSKSIQFIEIIAKGI